MLQASAVAAQEQARRFNHNYIGTEHLLLGLVREGDGVAAKVLAKCGADLSKLRAAIDFIIGRGDHVEFGEIGLTPRAKKVFDLAVDEARRLHHHYIGTEHLLLGLVREGEGIAVGVLESLGINLEEVRTQTVKALFQPSQPSKTPTLDQMGIDLTMCARLGEFGRVVGHEQEIERVIQILSRRQKNNPALVSMPGVGKTAIVEELARQIVAGEVPETLTSKRLLTLDITLLRTGTKDRGEFEERLKKIIEEIRSSQDCIIFIDEVHTLVGAGAAEGAVDAANILKPALSRGELQCIGATTLDEYRKYIEKDAALQRRFQEVMVREPSVEETLEILKGLRDRYESHHRLTISDDALRAAAEMGSRYITDRFMPDKAIDLIDEASSRVRMQRSLAPLNLKEAMRGLEAVLREKDEAIQNQQYEQAQELLEREKKLRERITKLESGWHKDQSSEKPVVTEEDIAQIVSMWTGIPVMRIMQGEAVPLGEMEDTTRAATSSSPGSEHKIFISYSHEDEDLCRVLANELARVDFNAWYDYHLQGGVA